MLVRSPTTTNPMSGVMLSGSSPEKRGKLGIADRRIPPRMVRYSSAACGIGRGGNSRTASAIAADMVRRCSAAAADQVQPAVARPFAQFSARAFRVFPEIPSRIADRAVRHSDTR